MDPKRRSICVVISQLDYSHLQELVELGVYRSISDAVRDAIRQQWRTYMGGKEGLKNEKHEHTI